MAESELESSYQRCLDVVRRSGSTFVLAFRTLPRPMFRDMVVLYAFMRHTDDLGDDQAVPIAQRRIRLATWEDDLRAALAGNPPRSPLLPALAELALRRSIPAIHLHDVIRGVQTDLDPREFATFADLDQYCYLVAGAVGLCCLPVWGHRGELPREPALACGTAFQLTNILRDLAADARQGRVYLPTEDLRRFGVSQPQLAASRFDPQLRPLLEFETSRAWNHYRRALPLYESLDPDGRRIFSSFLELYSSLLREIEKRNFDVFSQPVRLPRWRKATVLLRCLLRLPRHPARCLPELQK